MRGSLYDGWLWRGVTAVAALLAGVCFSAAAQAPAALDTVNTAALETAPQPAAAGAPRPNVVLFILDTVRADTMACYGGTRNAMPEMDRYAEQGVVFGHVLSNSSWTRPSIGSFLTSKYPRTIGIYDEKDDILDDRFTQLAEVLHAAGYTTLGFTANPNLNTTFNFHQGFDEYTDSGVIFDWMPKEPDKVSRGFQSLPSTHDLCAKAVGALDARAGQAGPFYLQFNFMEVHEWVVPSTKPYSLLREPYSRMYKDEQFAQYWQSARQLSDDVEQFVELLKARPGWEDTLFVFVSDHGEGLGDHPSVFRSTWHGRVLYESNLDVVWFLYRPGWRPTAPRVEEQVCLLDVMPTVLDMAGVPAPSGLDGLSLKPLFDGEIVCMDLPQYVIAESEFKESNKIAVYGAQWKFIHSFTPHPGIAPLELQRRGMGPDLENGTLTNHFSKEPSVTRRFEEYLREWQRQHPKTPASTVRGGLNAEMQERLEALGYLDADESRGGDAAPDSDTDTMEKEKSQEAEDTSP